MPEASRSIGQVLAVVKVDFPDITISKIRFLESEGLLSPERAPSGYRRYRQADVDRLRYILAMQKNHYLPLKVIREHLDMLDRGLTPPALEAPVPGGAAPVPETAQPTQPAAAQPPSVSPSVSAPAPAPRPPAPEPAPRRPIRLTRRELLEQSGLSEAALLELERQLIIRPRRGTAYFGRDALTLAVAARRLAGYGIDARHLRAFKQAAEREVGIVEQATAPYVRRNARTAEAQADVLQLVIAAHAALMQAAMRG